MRLSGASAAAIGALLAVGLCLPAFAQSAALLPSGRQVFVDSNGAPLAGGSVGFYIPNTLTPKTTWSDPGEANPNQDPMGLDSAGSAVIYGSGQYREILKDANGNTLWDELTFGQGALPFWGGTSTGTGNAQVVNAPAFTSTAGQQVSFLVGPGLTNTGPTTLNAGNGPLSVTIPGAAGPQALAGGELQAGTLVTVAYSATAGNWQIVSYVGSVGIPNGSITNAKLAAMAAATLKGNATAASAAPQDLSTSVVRALPGIAPQGYLWGLGLANDSTSPGTVIDVAAGEAASTGSSPTLMALPTGLAKVVNAAWSAGNNSGCLSTGTFANGTYHVFEIENPATAVVDVLCDVSPTSPTLPSGFTLFRRIGSIVVKSSAILPFVQTGDDFFWNTSGGYADIAAGVTKSLVTITVPTGVRVLAFFHATAYGISGTASHTSLFDGAHANVESSIAVGANNNAYEGPLEQFTNTSAQVYADTAATGGGASTIGWQDTRGQ